MGRFEVDEQLVEGNENESTDIVSRWAKQLGDMVRRRFFRTDNYYIVDDDPNCEREKEKRDKL